MKLHEIEQLSFKIIDKEAGYSISEIKRHSSTVNGNVVPLPAWRYTLEQAPR